VSRHLVLAAALAAATACGGASSSGSPGSNNGGTKATRLARLGITDAKTLFVAATGGTGSTHLAANELPRSSGDQAASPSAASQSTLYKITADNHVLEVTNTCFVDDGTGTGTTTEAPCTTAYSALGIQPAGHDYVFVWFQSGDQVLVRKSDGRAFRANGIGLPTQTQPPSIPPLLQTDAGGNIYYPSGNLMQSSVRDGAVARIDVTDPARLVVTAITPSVDYVDQFIVDAAGDVVYPSGASIVRARTAAGAIVDLPSYNAGMGMPWVGLDGQLYASRGTFEGGAFSGEILKLGLADGVLTLTQTATWSGNPASAFGWTPVAMGGSLYFAGYGSAGRDIFEVASPTEAPVVYSLPAASASFVGASSSSLWFYGKNSAGVPAYFFRWTKAGATQVMAPGAYDIVTASVSSDDVVTFTALRLSDGAKVLGRVDATGTVTVLDQGTAAQAVTLVPIN
jgi:hypothetical protein